MSRTNETAVKGIIEVDVTIALSPFIEVANELVTEVCASVTNDDGSAFYSTTRLELIERWLAAHFYAIRDPRVSQERAGPVAQSFMYKVGLNLAVTIYGQQVMMLDTAGGLAALSKSAEEGAGARKVSVSWLGTDDDDVEDIE